jgi:hypothetical protein
MDLLLATAFPEGRISHALRLDLHLHNCRAHSSNASKQCCDENSLVTVLQPVYSLDLAPSDFRVLGHIKTSLAGRVFNDGYELFEGVVEFLNEIQASELQFVFHCWTERITQVFANNGADHHE